MAALTHTSTILFPGLLKNRTSATGLGDPHRAFPSPVRSKAGHPMLISDLIATDSEYLVYSHHLPLFVFFFFQYTKFASLSAIVSSGYHNTVILIHDIIELFG